LLGAVPGSYQVTPDIPDRRRATQQKEVRPTGRRPQRESARRPVGTVSTASDVTDEANPNSKPQGSGESSDRDPCDGTDVRLFPGMSTQTDWRQLLGCIGSHVGLRPGCEAAELDGAERVLGITLPQELREFLAATDGLYDRHAQHDYGWPLQRVVSENTDAWKHNEMALDRDLLAFGDDGAGDWFCVPVSSGRHAEVVHWGWIGHERRTIAPSVRKFWEGWYDGSITV
jgi:hypothetical protein